MKRRWEEPQVYGMDVAPPTLGHCLNGASATTAGCFAGSVTGGDDPSAHTCSTGGAAGSADGSQGCRSGNLAGVAGCSTGNDPGVYWS